MDTIVMFSYVKWLRSSSLQEMESIPQPLKVAGLVLANRIEWKWQCHILRLGILEPFLVSFAAFQTLFQHVASLLKDEEAWRAETGHPSWGLSRPTSPELTQQLTTDAWVSPSSPKEQLRWVHTDLGANINEYMRGKN